MILGMICGFAAHGTHYLIDRWQSADQWKLLVRYAIGSGVVATIYFYMTARKHGTDEAIDQTERLLTANVSVGFGVLVGWIADDLYKEYKK